MIKQREIQEDVVSMLDQIADLLRAVRESIAEDAPGEESADSEDE